MARGGTWRRTGALTDVRLDQTATLLPDGAVLVVGGVQGGGMDGESFPRSAERYDPATGAWRRVGQSPIRAGHTATLLADGDVLVVGGYDDRNTILADTRLYHLRTGTWSTTGRMAVAREGHTATLLPNGQVLVMGGRTGVMASGYEAMSAEVYDPATGTWSTTGRMAVARNGHTATLLPNGQVLVVGGGSRRAEMYGLATGRWTGAGSVDAEGSTATLLSDGRVLIAGGCGPARRPAAALYDPVTGRWSPTGGLRTAREEHTATLLSDGTVLVAGGVSCRDISYRPATAERYDPATGTWSAAGSMAAPRSLHTATLLRDGTVLVAGGHIVTTYGRDSGYADVASAELYQPA